jgi:hypothetical protein
MGQKYPNFIFWKLEFFSFKKTHPIAYFLYRLLNKFNNNFLLATIEAIRE